MKYKFILFLFVFYISGFVFAEELDLEKYKKAYIEQIKPILEKQIAPMLERQEDPDATLDFLASGMANCQVEILSYYPEKYQAATVNPVLAGKGLKEVTIDVNELMKQDIEAGNTTREEVIAMVQSSREHFINCSKELDKGLKN